MQRRHANRWRLVMVISFMASLASLVAASGALAAAGRPLGQLRGYNEIEKALKTQILADPQFQLYQVFGPSYYVVQNLLGQFESGTYQGGGPNAFNMYLWENLMLQLATAIASHCTLTPNLTLQPEFQQLISRLCQRHDSAALNTVWLKIVGFGDDAAYSRWYQALERSGLTTISAAEERVRLILYTLFMNPRFLLEP